MKVLMYVVCILFALPSCKANVNSDILQNRKQAIDITNRASSIVRLVAENPELKTDSIYLYGISQFEKAIKLDSTLQMPYVNKINFLIHLNQYDKAIKFIDTMKIRFSSNKECVIGQGFLYEKVGKKDSALLIYNGLKQMYVQNVRNNPADLKSKIKIVELDFYITNNRENALKQVDELLKEFPDNWELKSYKDILQFFNKEDLFQ